MSAFFIFNNIKVNPFIIGDAPFPGFDLISWEHESWIPCGQLWDLGQDAGLTMIGNKRIKGQVWIAQDLSKIKDLEYFLGIERGKIEPVKVKVIIKPHGDLIQDIIEVTTYCLTKIDKSYNIVNDETWTVKKC